MKNEYEIRGDVTAIFLNSPKYGKSETLISTNKLEMLLKIENTWNLALWKRSNSFYVQSTQRKTKNKSTLVLQRFLTNATDGMVVDHINHNTLDNTDKNLRVVSQSENMQNRKGVTTRNTSGYRGVSWHKASQKWTASISLDKKMKCLGYFNDVKEADRIAREARQKFYISAT